MAFTLEHPFLSLVSVAIEGDDPVPVHLSRPEGTPTAGIIVCHHACGIYQDAFQKTFCDRLAQAGFLVALPDFFHRTCSS